MLVSVDLETLETQGIPLPMQRLFLIHLRPGQVLVDSNAVIEENQVPDVVNNLPMGIYSMRKTSMQSTCAKRWQMKGW